MEAVPVDAQEFAKADRVRARSGGPVMAVEEVYDPVFQFRYRCVWTDESGSPRHGLFRAEQLERVDPPPGTSR